MTTLNFDSLVEGKPVQVDVEGVKVCVARVGDEVFAISDICSHAEANLSEGEYKGYVIECWLHGAEFDLRTGEGKFIFSFELTSKPHSAIIQLYNSEQLEVILFREQKI